MKTRRILLLQGPATPFNKTLAKAVEYAGHEVFQVRFCGGDWLFSLGVRGWRFNDTIEALPEWLGKKLSEYSFTDIIVFGDTRPIHEAAIQFVKGAGVNVAVHVFEEGYLRPDWITLEKNGVNGYSDLMQKKSAWYQGYQCKGTKQNLPTGSNFYVRLWHDISYRVANFLLFPFFYHYKTHRPCNELIEYLGWMKRYPLRFLYLRGDNSKIQSLVSKKRKYFFFPLQLDSDSQIKVHSDFSGMSDAIETVVSSFAKNASSDSFLVVKNHPLDTGLISYKKIIRNLAASHGISGRVIYLENGHIPTLVSHAKGTVVVNSTVGMSALVHHNPVCILGQAIYNLPGLTEQKGLDYFWKHPSRPNRKLFNKFRSAIIDLTQVNGNFYSRKGIQMAVSNSLDMMGISSIASERKTVSDSTSSRGELFELVVKPHNVES